MFLDLIKRRNHKLITASQKLHQKGLVPANSYIIDLDIVEQNAKIFKNTADKFGLKTFLSYPFDKLAGFRALFFELKQLSSVSHHL